MTTVVLKKTHLAAMLVLSAEKDIRYYLNGVCLELGLTESRLIATDGHLMGILRLPDVKSTAVGSYIIPSEAIAPFKVTAKGVPDVTLEIETTEKGELSDGSMRYAFTFLEGRYPEYRRVIPKGELSGVAAQFNPALLTRFAKAAKILNGTKYVNLGHNGPNNGMRVFIDGMPEFLGVMMPWRSDLPEKEPEWVMEPVVAEVA